LGEKTYMRMFLTFLIWLTAMGCQHPRFVRSVPLNPTGPAYLRLRNASKMDLLDVVFQRNRFGNIKAGALTDYQPAAYVPTAATTLLPGELDWTEISAGLPNATKRARHIYVDWAERYVAHPGWWTFSLTLNETSYGPQLWVQAESDERIAQPTGAANRSQPVGSLTNRTSAAAGSGR
jgi:hypothetical protein